MSYILKYEAEHEELGYEQEDEFCEDTPRVTLVCKKCRGECSVYIVRSQEHPMYDHVASKCCNERVEEVYK